MCPKPRMVEIPETGRKVGTGWLRPVPDFRDYTEAAPEIKPMTKKLGLAAKGNKSNSLPAKVDLRPWCSPIEDQKRLGSCTAHAAVGVVEYFQRRAFRRHIEGSRLFVYKVTRNLMQEEGDVGGWLRTTMGALVLCGLPDEKYWPYTDSESEFDWDPPSFVYAVADNFETVKYFCHDPIDAKVSRDGVLTSVKKYLASGIPSMFGFDGFQSFSSSDVPGGIPYPCPGESWQWGHAVVAVGYDDGKKIKNTRCNKTSTGALLIRNSWGMGWGDNGYGWLPYDYVRSGLASDFWSLVSMEWVDTKQFGI